MNLQDLGHTAALAKHKEEQSWNDFGTARVILEHKERYIIKDGEQEYEAELIGNLRFTAQDRYDFPAVGDWVAFTEYDEDKALIHGIYTRQSIIERKAVSSSGQVQIIGTNIDYGIIVQAVDRDFNLNRLERYLSICHTAKVSPIIVLSKIDLIDESELENILSSTNLRIKDAKVITVSNVTKGYEDVKSLIKKGKTYCLLGSSGVGKSTLLNALMSEEVMATREISTSVNKGKHTTSHRELFILEGGGIIIDNPGMREVGITDDTAGFEMTFDDILSLAQDCKFSDCSHIHEEGCAIIAAVENGELDENAYQNFLKMGREREHFEAEVHERRQKDKDFGKMVRNVKAFKKRFK